MSRISKKTILIIGYIPPPIGGLAIHVKRLLNVLESFDIRYDFINYLAKFNPLTLLIQILSHKVIHLHSANPYMRLMVALFCKLTQRVLILTFHGNLGRYTTLKNKADIWAIILAKYPVLINKDSYKIALNLNKNCKLVSAFIPAEDANFSENLSTEITYWKKSYESIFCTNAFKFKLDKEGQEIYGITELSKIFKQLPSKGLIISDPSGDYKKSFQGANINLSPNIFLISIPHPFVGIIKLSDAFIRATTTDGDSLSVKEAIYADKVVIASDCVSRPAGCILYQCKNFEDLEKKIDQFKLENGNNYGEVIDGSVELLNLYKELLNQ